MDSSTNNDILNFVNDNNIINKNDDKKQKEYLFYQIVNYR
jgi:hypothetical protein